MSNRFLPYDTIIEAHEGDPKAVKAVLNRYTGYIRYFSLFRLPHRRRLRERYRRSIEKKYCRETVLWKKCR